MQQNESPLIRALTEYYDGNKILSTNFHCKCQRDCQDCLPSTPSGATTLEDVAGTFTEAHAAYVGDRYYKTDPRLLFVALDLGTVLRKDDPGFSYVRPESRTLEGVRAVRTRIMERILSGTDTHIRTGKPIQRWTVNGMNEIAGPILGNSGADVMRSFAYVNAVKCTMNKSGRGVADSRLYRNCREYLRGEVDILSPDVIVTLGREAFQSVKHAFRQEIRADNIKSHARPNVWTIETSDRPRMLWLNAFHPSRRSRPKFDEQMGGGNDGPIAIGKLRMESRKAPCGITGYAELIRDFISNRDS